MHQSFGAQSAIFARKAFEAAAMPSGYKKVTENFDSALFPARDL
jgi:hypothetical protein